MEEIRPFYEIVSHCEAHESKRPNVRNRFQYMATMHLLKEHGILGYRIPGRKVQDSLIEWNAMVEESLALVFAAHRPSMFVFDGAYPTEECLTALRDEMTSPKYG